MNKILFTSIPKCGTHLLLNYLRKVGFKHAGPYAEIHWRDEFMNYVQNLRPGHCSSWHYRWSQELSDIIRDCGVKVVFLYRDPRAQLVSLMHFIMKTPDHPWHDYLAKHLDSPAERLRRIIEGFSFEELPLLRRKDIETGDLSDDAPGVRERKYGGVREEYLLYENWLHERSCFRVKFEDIVGPEGGGSAERQLEVVTELMAFTGVCNDVREPQVVAKALFDKGTATFRKGQIDSWRDDFTPELYELFLREFGHKMALWGYQP